MTLRQLGAKPIKKILRFYNLKNQLKRRRQFLFQIKTFVDKIRVDLLNCSKLSSRVWRVGKVVGLEVKWY